MMDSVPDESSLHLCSNLTLLIVTSIISVSSLSYCPEPMSSSRSSGPAVALGFAPLPVQFLVAPHGSTLLPEHGEERVEVKAGSGPWAL